MPEEKKEQEIIVKKDELSDQQLDQASGGAKIEHVHESDEPKRAEYKVEGL